LNDYTWGLGATAIMAASQLSYRRRKESDRHRAEGKSDRPVAQLKCAEARLRRGRPHAASCVSPAQARKSLRNQMPARLEK